MTIAQKFTELDNMHTGALAMERELRLVCPGSHRITGLSLRSGILAKSHTCTCNVGCSYGNKMTLARRAEFFKTWNLLVSRE